jgi:hypothetical protein
MNEKTKAGRISPSENWLYYNGTIYTADENDSVVEALVVSDGIIKYAGSLIEARRVITEPYEEINLEGRMLLPGFIDGHLHPPGRALVELFNISLYEASDLVDLSERVSSFIQKHPGRDIYYGEGFSLGLFSGSEVSLGPSKERLDRICSDKPVVLYSSDCHLAWLNSKALEQFGIDKNTISPAGGVVERDPESGEPLGALKEAAMQLIPRQQFSLSQIKEAMLTFQAYLHSLGYTGIFAASITEPPPLELYRELADSGELKLHIASSASLQPGDDLAEKIEQINADRLEYSYGSHQLTAVKIFADGVVEGATAYLKEPYHPAAGKAPGYRGELLWSTDKLAAAIALANRASLQVHIHSIGDAATGVVLDAFEKAAAGKPSDTCRNTITHLQLVAPEDIRRFARLGVIAAVQPYWHCKEPDWWEAVDQLMLGERAESEYPLAAFIKAGVKVVSSSDHPVTPVPNPFMAIRAGMTRNLYDEEKYGLPLLENPDDPRWLLGKNERATLTEMLRSFTINGACAIFRENQTGSLEAGKQADMIIIDRDLFAVDPLEAGRASVLATFYKGRLVYRADNYSWQR